MLERHCDQIYITRLAGRDLERQYRAYEAQIIISIGVQIFILQVNLIRMSVFPIIDELGEY